MNKGYCVILIILNMHSYAQDTVKSVLTQWKANISDTSIQNMATYNQGYNVGFEIGKALSKEEAVTILKSWVYFKATQKNQTDCNLDATVNLAIEGIIKNMAQSALVGKLQGQIGNAIERKLQTTSQSAKSYVSETASQAYSYVSEKASAAKTGITSRIGNWWKWLTRQQ